MKRKCRALSKNKRRKLNVVERREERNEPRYVEVALYKTNMDSMQAIHYVAKRLKKFSKQFSLCGNKDKRGITTQRISIQGIAPQKLIAL